MIIEDVRLAGSGRTVSLEVDAGEITGLREGRARSDDGRAGRAEHEVFQGGGALCVPGFTDVHIHLDKANLLAAGPGGEGMLGDAIASVRRAKSQFTVDDVYRRAERVVRSAVLSGTNIMRSFVETDADAGLVSLEALLRLREDYADVIDLRLSAFAQDGLTQLPGGVDILRSALLMGAEEVAGCPYTDPDPGAHVVTLFDLAQEFGVPLDFHVDFDLDPSWNTVGLIADEARRRGFSPRLSVGHVTKLTAMEPAARDELVARLAESGVALVVLPATDVYLTGTVVPPDDRLLMALATNNVVNPFTPFGDADLLRLANLYATVTHRGSDRDLARIWDMITDSADAVLGVRRRIEVGGPATFILVDAEDPIDAVRRSAPVTSAWFRGERVFERTVSGLSGPGRAAGIRSVLGWSHD